MTRFLVRSGWLLLLPLYVAAQPPAEIPQRPVASTTTVVVSTPSIALTGESKDLPTPHAMTQGDPRSLFSLTRSSLDRAHWPTSVEVLSSEDLNRFGARNAGEAIARLMGVDARAFGETESPLSVGVRGASDRQTLILLDGRPVAGLSLAPPDLSEIPLEQIDRIEIIRGGLSAVYGPNATAGVINILSKRSVNAGLPISHYSYEARSYSAHTNRLDFGSRMGRFDYVFYGSGHRVSGFRDASDNRRTNIGGNVGVDLGKVGHLQFDGGNFHRHAGWTGQDPLRLDPSAFNNKDEKLGTRLSAFRTTDSVYGRSSWLVPLPNDQSLALRMFVTKRSLEQNDPSNANAALRIQTEDHGRSAGGEIQWNAPLGLSLGSSLTRDSLDHQDPLTPASAVQANAEDWSVWAQESVSLRALTLVGTGRWDHHSQFGEFFSPRALAQVNAASWLRLSASASRSFGVPRLEDLVVNSSLWHANAHLRPEETWTYESGFELHQDSTSARVTFYRAKVSDALEMRPVTLDAIENVADVQRQGIETELRYAFSRSVRHTLRYVYADNRGRPGTSSERVTLPMSPRHRADWDFIFFPFKKWPLWRIDSIVRYRADSYSDYAETGRKTVSRVTWDWRVSWPWRQAELFAGVNNVTNQRYEDFDGYPLPGVTAYGGIRIRLWG